ncbi:MAG: hypothetical protein KTR32_00570, partial [Granulosicoccus sp.]|nr:hypothetical protein [Granulosicoccus sp.]
MRILFLFLSSFTASLNASAVDFKAFPLPHNASLKVVTANANHNGVDISIAILQAESPLSETIEFYRTIWQEPVAPEMPGYIETQARGWIYLSRLSDGISLVVQFDSGLTEETFAYVSLLPVSEPVNFPEDPDFKGFRRLSSTMSRDGLLVSVFAVYASHTSVEVTIDRSLRHLTNRGWSLISENKQSGSRSVVFARSRARLEVV